jgi:hypothetical protein
MNIVDERLKLRTYLVSHSISPADIVFFFNFRAVKEYLFYLCIVLLIKKLKTWLT